MFYRVEIGLVSALEGIRHMKYTTCESSNFGDKITGF